MKKLFWLAVTVALVLTVASTSVFAAPIPPQADTYIN